MFRKPFTYKEGTIVALAFAIFGVLMQILVGAVNWQLCSWPVNGIMLVCYVLLLVGIFMLRKKVYVCRWMMQYTAAVPSIALAAVATTVLGLSNWTSLLSHWSFVLIYTWLTSIIGLVSIDRIVHFKWKNMPFLLNHTGLFIAIVGATLGNADVRKLMMSTYEGEAEWRAIDDKKFIHELPLAIQLDKFILETYPTGEPKRYASEVEIFTKEGKHEFAVIDVNKPYEIDGWKIYQYSYDVARGKDSKMSVFELVRDPWLPMVYAGIFMLIAGALYMFVTAGRKEARQ